MFGTPDRYGVSPQDNIFVTSPGLEQQALRSQFTLNGLVPIFFNANADLAPVTGPAGSNSAEFSSILGVSWSTPVLDLPPRFTANVRAEVDRFIQAWQPSVSFANFDKVALTERLQYIDPANDQAFSPYLAYVARFDFDPFFAEHFASRQDLNLGGNKTYNFDSEFKRVPISPDTFSDTVWSLGMTAFAQRRFRDPAPSSWGFFMIPSATYVINERWNLSLGAELMFRTFDSDLGFTQNEWFLEPIVTLEFVRPAGWSARTATPRCSAGRRSTCRRPMNATGRTLRPSTTQFGTSALLSNLAGGSDDHASRGSGLVPGIGVHRTDHRGIATAQAPLRAYLYAGNDWRRVAALCGPGLCRCGRGRSTFRLERFNRLFPDGDSNQAPAVSAIASAPRFVIPIMTSQSQFGTRCTTRGLDAKNRARRCHILIEP
jgi:hypothetical protein